MREYEQYHVIQNQDGHVDNDGNLTRFETWDSLQNLGAFIYNRQLIIPIRSEHIESLEEIIDCTEPFILEWLRPIVLIEAPVNAVLHHCINVFPTLFGLCLVRDIPLSIEEAEWLARILGDQAQLSLLELSGYNAWDKSHLTRWEVGVRNRLYNEFLNCSNETTHYLLNSNNIMPLLLVMPTLQELNTLILKFTNLYVDNVRDLDLESHFWDILTRYPSLKTIDVHGYSGRIFDRPHELNFVAGPSLQYLSLGGTAYMNQVPMGDCYSKLTTLHILNNDRHTLTDTYTKKWELRDNITLALDNKPNLQSLSLREQGLTKGYSGQLSGTFLKSLKETPLKILDVPNHQIKSIHLGQLHFSKMKLTLTHLNLYRNAINDDGLTHLAASLLVIQSIDLSYNQLTADSIEYMQHFKETLRDIRLKGNQFNYSDRFTILAQFEQTHPITNIVIFNTAEKTDPVVQFVRYGKLHSPILDLTGLPADRRIGTVGARWLCRHLMPSLNLNAIYLEHLSPTDIIPILLALAPLQSFTTLKLIGDSSFSPMLTADNIALLNELNLQKLVLQVSSLHKFRDFPNLETLQSLEFSHQKFWDGANSPHIWSELLSLIKHKTPNLTELDLSHNQLSFERNGESVKAFANYICSNQHRITALKLSGNKLGRSVGLFLEKQTDDCTLTRLNIASNGHHCEGYRGFGHLQKFLGVPNHHIRSLTINCSIIDWQGGVRGMSKKSWSSDYPYKLNELAENQTLTELVLYNSGLGITKPIYMDLAFHKSMKLFAHDIATSSIETIGFAEEEPDCPGSIPRYQRTDDSFVSRLRNIYCTIGRYLPPKIMSIYFFISCFDNYDAHRLRSSLHNSCGEGAELLRNRRYTFFVPHDEFSVLQEKFADYDKDLISVVPFDSGKVRQL